MTRHQRDFIILLVVIGLGAAGYVGYSRIFSENSSRQVALCVDYTEVVRLAGLTDEPVHSILLRLSQAGASHCAIKETTLNDMLLTSKAGLAAPDGRWLGARTGDDEAIEAFHAKVPGVHIEQESFGGGRLTERRQPMGPRTTARFSGDMSVFGSIGLGYHPAAVNDIRQSPLQPIARPVANFCSTPEAIEYSMRQAADIGARLVIFHGDRIVGAPGMTGLTALQMREEDLSFGMVELVPQAGEYRLAKALDSRIHRCHSISPEEMETMSAQEALDRYMLAVTERKVRICYVRLLLSPSEDLLSENTDYVHSLFSRLSSRGYSVGQPAMFRPTDMPPMLMRVLVLGVLGGFLWLLQTTCGIGAKPFWLTAGAGFLAAMAVTTPGFALGGPLVALAAALIFPTVAVLSLRQSSYGNAECHEPVTILQAAGLLIRTSVITAIGGLIAAAVLSQDAYLMKIEQFRGVKLAQALPLVVIGIILAARATQAYRETLIDSSRWEALGRGLAEIGRASVRYWHAGVVVVLMGMVGYMLMRSGNEPAFGVAELETQMRAALDSVLGVRPRTKEIFFGFPMLYVGLMLLLNGRWRTYWLFLALGAISQVSLFNTFCHLHTPLTISLVRIAHGIWVGLLLGLLVWGIKRIGDAILARINPPETPET